MPDCGKSEAGDRLVRHVRERGREGERKGRRFAGRGSEDQGDYLERYGVVYVSVAQFSGTGQRGDVPLSDEGTCLGVLLRLIAVF